jgi:hypothetical protein
MQTFFMTPLEQKSENEDSRRLLVRDMIDADIAEQSKLAGEARRQLSDIAVR